VLAGTPFATGGGPAIRHDVEVERVWLDDRSWVDVRRGWLAGAEEVYESVRENAAWQQGRLFRYERWIEEPRLTAAGSSVKHPALVEADRELRKLYKVSFTHFALAYYRSGRDSIAFHRDRDLRWLEDTRIALLILGNRRPFLLRPRSARYDHDAPMQGATHDFAPGNGDLIVMGGASQVGWEHAVPKVASTVGGRISAQWRWTSRTGRPVEGASFRAPRHFSRRT
jgi:hypothetical protein